MFCSTECENSINQSIQAIEHKRYDAICRFCALEFRRVDSHIRTNICDTCKHQQKYLKREETYRNKPKVEKPKKQRKKISYEELNRRAEYKRVFDDSGWKHYLKGRKWDRI